MKTVFCKLLLLATILVLFSGVAFAQYSWTTHPGNPLAVHGAPGSWDQSVVTPCVIFNPDSNRYEMWYTSYTGAYPNAGIGFAKSSDGITWTRHPNAVMTPSGTGWDAVSVGECSVIKEGNVYKMWYTGHPNATRTPSYIGYATSTDGGIAWQKHGDPVLSPGTGWESARVEFPSVIKVTGGYWMFYTGELAHGIARTGRAFSTDGINWQRDSVNNPVLPAGGAGAWDRNNYLAKVIELNNVLYLCYTAEDNPSVSGTAIGVATSTDTGKTWTKDTTGNPVITRGAGWDAGWIETGSMLFSQGTFRMYYDGGGASTGWFGRVGLATAPLVFVEPVEGTPTEFMLSQNYPNPFNPTTTISYTLPTQARVRISVFDMLGREIATLVDEVKQRGTHPVQWDASAMASGMYVCRMQAGDFLAVRKLLLMK